MRQFGPNRTALHFRRAKKKAGEAQDEADEPQKYRLEEGDGTTHAQRIVRELYLRYEKQLQRWKDYRNLFVFLAFVALFLAVLYLQRNADVAYKVHSTVESVVVPENDIMQTTDEVYVWLDDLLTEVWKDPVCGDGLCEAPFEFASYSRFGCRADCGRLSEVQNLTQIQIDVYYDFSHPVGSIPAADLMQQAAWNLCPVSTPYSTDCYYDTDIMFDRLSGAQMYIIDDAPDGEWNLVVKRDIFNKLRGAVRISSLLSFSGYLYKIYIAAAAARAEQEFEISLLQEAITIANTEFWTYANSSIRATYANSSEYEAAAAWIRNSTCHCSGVTNDTDVFGTAAMMLYLNQSISRTDPTKNFSMSYMDYMSDYCPNGTIVPQWYRGMNDSNGNWTKVFVPVDISNATAQTDWCSRGLSLSINWRDLMTGAAQKNMVEKRLGDSRTTGKISRRNEVNANLRNFLSVNYPELVNPIYVDSRGTVALQDPVHARIDYLMPLYVESVRFTISQPQVAAINMRKSVVYDSGTTLLTLAALAAARISEVREQMTDVASIALPMPMYFYNSSGQTYTWANTTVGALYDTFVGAGANTTWLPGPSNASLRVLAVDYNLAEWDGNTTSYMRCSLDMRAPEYVGECVAMNSTCLATTNDTVPYTCTDITNGFAPIPGSLANSSYRMACETPCDRKFDCDSICECFGACSNTEYCECAACRTLAVDATQDSQFKDIRSWSMDVDTATTFIAPLDEVWLARRASQRRLLEGATNDEIIAQLQNVVRDVANVSIRQSDISTQMTDLKVQVDTANRLAVERAKSNDVISAIESGKAEMRASQDEIMKKLDTIIGKQNEALDKADKAAAALDDIKSLSTKQKETLERLDAAVESQLSSIRTATHRGIINLTQALALWKKARRDRARTIKAAKLANIPCNNQPTAGSNFTLDNDNLVDTKTSRERNVGLTNRVIAGLLLHQTRTNETLCPESKFVNISRFCTGPQTVASYGVDPVFKRGTTLYNPDYDDAEGKKVVNFYNCSELADATYNINFLNQTVNQEPYCAELYNPQDLPYAFHFFPLEAKPDGFPVYFDINLSQEGAQEWYTYINEGLYLDQNTRTMTAELVTYNAQLRIFSYYYIKFHFSDGGSIKVSYRLNTVRVELYNSYSDDVRFGFEIILSMWIFTMMLYNLWEIAYTQKTRGNFLKYFLSGWHWVEFASNGLLTACIIIWWIFVEQYAKKFNIDIRYDVYQSLSPDANYLALEDNGANLVAVNEAFSDLRELVDMLNWYFALNGINILLLIARMLKLMDFQPRLGVVTRSLWLAGPDLIHFAIVAGMVFVGYAMMAHLIFGNAIEAFATFGDSINTCFEILLGNIDVNEELRALGGLQSVAGALFFWSYELLVFMVLLNFLLAIIVDAFSEVKERTQETVGIHTELFTLLRDKWRSLLGRCSPNYISDAKLGELLRQWAGEEDEQPGDAAAVEEKRKLLTILNEDMDEETLREVFKECLRDAPDSTDRAKAAASAGLLSRLFHRAHGGGGAQGLEATEEEIIQAAHYIVERFGTVPQDEDEEDDDGVGGPDSMGPPPPGPGAGSAGGALAASGGGAGREAVLEKERDQLAQALERLAEVQRELAEGQRNLMNGQKQLAEQQSKLVQLMNEQPPTGN